MKVKVSIVTTAILVIGLLGNFLSESVMPVSAEEIGAIGLSKPIVESIHQVGKSASNKCTLKTSVSSKGVTVKWSVSKKKKSSFKNVQIKVATKKSMKSAKTYKFGKSTAKKGSYQLTVKSGKVKANKTYYIQVRVKVKNKWTKWSSQKKVKTKKATTSKKKTEEAKNDLSKYKCTHTLEKGVTSKIVKAGGQIFDVHTYADDTSKAIQPIFQVYLMAWSDKLKKGMYPESGGTQGQIDYSKLSYSFDNGSSGELWNWLPLDVENMQIYSVPNYATAIADIYCKPGAKQFTKFTVTEETVPHKVDGSYVAELKYGGETLVKTTRSKKACINNSIKLFKDYGGEQYLQNIIANGGKITPKVFDDWQYQTFNYYGCQLGTILCMNLARFYCPGYKMAAVDINPLYDPNRTGVLPYNSQLDIPKTTMLTLDPECNGFDGEANDGTLAVYPVYAPRYKQFGLNTYGGAHVYYIYQLDNTQLDYVIQHGGRDKMKSKIGNATVWDECTRTGSSTAPGKQKFPTPSGIGTEFDFFGLIYQ